MGGCPNGEKVERVEIITMPDSGLPNGPWDKGYQPSGIQDPVKAAALALMDAVERYVCPKKGEFCHRTELLNKVRKLKELL